MRTAAPWPVFGLAAVLAALTASAGLRRGDPGAARADEPPPPAKRATRPVPIKADFFPTPQATIDGWINAAGGPNEGAIRGHAWALWAAITQPTDQAVDDKKLPVWETWYSRDEVFNRERARAAGRMPRIRDLEAARQQEHGAAQRAGIRGAGKADQRLITSVKYDPVAAQHVWDNHYNRPVVLSALNNGWPGGTAVARRAVREFPPPSVVLKPTYWVVNKTGLSIMPYWAGPDHSTRPDGPTPETWTQFVAVDPSGKQVGREVDYTFPANKKTYKARVVGLDRFYWFRLDKDVFDALQAGDPTLHMIVRLSSGNDAPVGPGDYVLLVGMHVTTKEIDNWTWQTFWWSADPQADPLAKDHPREVAGEWKNYAMSAAYYMMTPGKPGQKHVSYNPYLETQLGPQGIQSNCMSCHAAAVWPPLAGSYVLNGHVDPAEARRFGQATRLDFLWSIENANAENEQAEARKITGGK